VNLHNVAMKAGPLALNADQPTRFLEDEVVPTVFLNWPQDWNAQPDRCCCNFDLRDRALVVTTVHERTFVHEVMRDKM
jgi:hypothetical protein